MKNRKRARLAVSSGPLHPHRQLCRQSGSPLQKNLMPNSGSLPKRAAIIAGFVFVVVYAGDYGLLRYKMSGNTGLDTVTSYYGTPTKDGKMEIFTDQPQTETCVHSLFPHLGYRPCWYANRNNVTQVGALNYQRTFDSVVCRNAESFAQASLRWQPLAAVEAAPARHALAGDDAGKSRRGCGATVPRR